MAEACSVHAKGTRLPEARGARAEGKAHGQALAQVAGSRLKRENRGGWCWPQEGTRLSPSTEAEVLEWRPKTQQRVRRKQKTDPEEETGSRAQGHLSPRRAETGP